MCLIENIMFRITNFLEPQTVYPMFHTVSIMTSAFNDKTFITSRFNDVNFFFRGFYFVFTLHTIGSRKSSCHPYCVPYRKYEPWVDVRMEISNSTSLV